MISLADFMQDIPREKLLKAWQEKDAAVLRVRGIATALKATPFIMKVSGRGVWVNLMLSGSYTSLQGGADDGVCRVRLDWLNNNGRVYIEKPTSFDVLFSPGRVKTPGIAGSDSNPLNTYMPWISIWKPGDELTFNVTNDATSDNTIEIACFGFWRF